MAYMKAAFIDSIIEGVGRLANTPDCELLEKTIKELDRYVWGLPFVWDDGENNE